MIESIPTEAWLALGLLWFLIENWERKPKVVVPNKVLLKRIKELHARIAKAKDGEIIPCIDDGMIHLPPPQIMMVPNTEPIKPSHLALQISIDGGMGAKEVKNLIDSGAIADQIYGQLGEIAKNEKERVEQREKLEQLRQQDQAMQQQQGFGSQMFGLNSLQHREARYCDLHLAATGSLFGGIGSAFSGLLGGPNQ